MPSFRQAGHLTSPVYIPDGIRDRKSFLFAAVEVLMRPAGLCSERAFASISLRKSIFPNSYCVDWCRITSLCATTTTTTVAVSVAACHTAFAVIYNDVESPSNLYLVRVTARCGKGSGGYRHRQGAEGEVVWGMSTGTSNMELPSGAQTCQISETGLPLQFTWWRVDWGIVRSLSLHTTRMWVRVVRRCICTEYSILQTECLYLLIRYMKAHRKLKNFL